MIYLGDFRPPRWTLFLSIGIGIALILVGSVALGVILIVLIAALSVPWLADRLGLK